MANGPIGPGVRSVIGRHLTYGQRFALAAPALLLLAGYWSVLGGAWGPRFPSVDTWVVSALLLALTGLLWLRPRVPLYLLGVFAILLGFVGFWLASPVGWMWVHNNVLGGPATYSPYGGTWFGWLATILFPIGWLILAASIGRLRVGLGLYLAIGLIFALTFALSGLSGGSPPIVVALWVAYMLALWPTYVLAMLGIVGLFGRSFG